jgi:hypothetical protein
MRVSRSIYDADTLRRIEAGYNDVRKGRATIENVVALVPWFNEADPLAERLWEMLGAQLEDAYTDIVEDAGSGEAKEHGWPFRFKVTKAAELRVPINPFSIAWVRLKAGSLVREISDQQRELLREILTESFEEGQRSDAVLRDIEETVGLTVRERGWVQNRRGQLSVELEGDALDKAVGRYAALTLRRRARKIARTETIDAYAQGLDDVWELAKEDGQIDATVMQEWVELTASDRTCKICKGLGGQRVPVGEPFVSEFIGEVRRPPAHPHCRCTKILVFVDDEDVDESLARSNRDAIDARDKLAGG